MKGGNFTMCKKMKSIRLKNNLSVKDISNILDISQSFYYKLEQGTRNPTLKLARKISALYGVSVEELF